MDKIWLKHVAYIIEYDKVLVSDVIYSQWIVAQRDKFH